MAYKVYDTAQGSFCIDWDTCVHIIKSYNRALFQLTYSVERTESQTSIDPFSWSMPDLKYIEVDWPKVSQEATGHSILTAYRLAAVALFQKRGVDGMVRELLEMQRETRKLNATFQAKMTAASCESWDRMDTAISTYGGRLKFAQDARDYSGSILIGAATVVTGGTASVLAAGAGTALKATGKYQDSGDAGIAAIEASQNVICYLIPAMRATQIGTAAKVLVTASGDYAKAMLEPKPNGYIAVAIGVAGGMVSAIGGPVKNVLEKILPKTIVPIVTKVAQDRSKKKAQQALASRASSATITDDARLAGGRGLASHISFDDGLLVKLAVVDMSKGIGRSWW